MENLLSIGKILNFRGIHGEVKVGFSPGKEERLKKFKNLYLVLGSETMPVTVESIRFHKNFAIMKFKEFSSVDEIIKVKGAYLKVPKSQIQDELEEDEFYIDDLININAYDTEGNIIGKISNIAHLNKEDLLIIKDLDGQEHYVPFVKNLVPQVDIKNNKIVIKKIPGLLEELNDELSE